MLDNFLKIFVCLLLCVNAARKWRVIRLIPQWHSLTAFRVLVVVMRVLKMRGLFLTAFKYHLVWLVFNTVCSDRTEFQKFLSSNSFCCFQKEPIEAKDPLLHTRVWWFDIRQRRGLLRVASWWFRPQRDLETSNPKPNKHCGLIIIFFQTKRILHIIQGFDWTITT